MMQIEYERDVRPKNHKERSREMENMGMEPNQQREAGEEPQIQDEVNGNWGEREKPGLSRSLRLASFYCATGLHGMIVVPVLVITAFALYVSAGAIVLASAVTAFASIFHITLPFAILSLGFWSPPAVIAVPLALIIAGLCYLGGRQLWRLFKFYVMNVSARCDAIKSGRA